MPAILPCPPQRVINVEMLKGALSRLKEKEERRGKPCVIEYVQESIGGHFDIIPQSMAQRPGKKLGPGNYIVGVYDEKCLRDRIQYLEQEAERILAEEWREQSSELGIEARLQVGESCPLEDEFEGRRYCDESPLSQGRCRYNTGETILVAQREGGSIINPAKFRTRFVKELAERLNASDVQNICSYSPKKEG